MSALNLKTKTELLKLAQRLGLRGISTMTKPKLVETISRAKQSRTVMFRNQAAIAVQKVASVIKRRAMRKPAKVAAIAKSKAAAKAAVTLQAKATAKAAASANPQPAVKAVAVLKPKAAAKVPVTAKKANAVVVAAAMDQVAHKFDVAPVPQPATPVFPEENLGELPDTYGTGRLFLTARDPHWLFAYWDLSQSQLADFRRQATAGQVVLRVFEQNLPQPVAELTVTPDARNWYLPVNKAATSYSAELGFPRPDGGFNVISRSRETTTPPDMRSADTTARFATIPVDVNFPELLGIVRRHHTDGERLAEVLHRLQTAGFQFPFHVDVELGPWSSEQAAQVETVLSGDVRQRGQVSSVELTDWLRRRLEGETSSGLFSGFSPSSPGGASWSGQSPQGFWLAVNAELIISGATAPDAQVTVDGQPVPLRSDGTFSFRYTFPDGKFTLPIVAIAGHGGDQRAVELQFERKTQTHGAVGQVGQPAHRTPPATS